MILPKKYYNLIEKILIISLIILVAEFCFPHQIAKAQEVENSIELGPVLIQIISDKAMSRQHEINSLPEIENKKPKIVRWITVTAYSSTVDQCDETPFITANGKTVYDGLVAANFLSFGTKVKFPDYFGNKIFTVDDRMNEKYYYHIDIWMPTREQAIEFGAKYLKIEVY